MANYDIGNIALNITATVENADKAIDKLVGSIDVLTTSFNKLGKVSISSRGINSISKFFDKLNSLKISTDVANGLNSQSVALEKIATTMSGMKSADIATNATALRSFANATEKLSKVNLSGLDQSLEQLNKITLSDTFQSTFGSQKDLFKNFNSFANALPKLNELNLNFDQIKAQFTGLADAFDPFLQKIEQAKPALEAFNNAVDLSRIQRELDSINKRLDTTQAKTLSVKNTLKNWLNHLYATVNYCKRFARALTSVVQNAIDFNETLNKFQLAMRDNYDDAIGFVNRLTYAFNLSSESIMNYQATFKNMLANLGSLSDSVSTNLSALMTEFAIDFSSLYNVSIERSMTIFQSALSSQIRAIRSVSGFDITEKTLYDVYERMGGTKAMRGLSQLEKRLLIIATLQEQMQKAMATGDYTRTINEAASVLRQIQQSAKEATIWIGKFLLQTLEPLFQKVLSFILVVRDMAKAFVTSQPGYEEKDFISRLGDSANTATSAIEDTEEALENLKRSTLGFDQLNILGSSSASTTTDDIALILSNIEGSNNALSKTFENATSKAREMADIMLRNLGYVFDSEEQTWKIVDGTTTLSDILKRIARTLSIIVGLSVGLKLSNTLLKLPNIIDKISGVPDAISKIDTALKPINLTVSKIGAIGVVIAILVAGFTKLFLTNEKFRKNMEETFKSLMKNFEKFKPILEFVGNVIGWLLSKIGYAIGAVANIVDIITTILSGRFKDVPDAFNRFKENFIGFYDPTKFAEGGVVNKPTIGLMGEYPNASSNPEIVTPENKMREVFMESMLPLVQAILNGNREVVRSIDDLGDRPIELNGRKVSENIFNDLNDVAKRRGYKGFA